MRLWDLETGRELKSLEQAGIVRGLAFTPDGVHAIAGINPEGSNAPGAIHLWDLDRGVEVRRFDGHSFAVTSIAMALRWPAVPLLELRRYGSPLGHRQRPRTPPVDRAQGMGLDCGLQSPRRPRRFGRRGIRRRPERCPGPRFRLAVVGPLGQRQAQGQRQPRPALIEFSNRCELTDHARGIECPSH